MGRYVYQIEESTFDTRHYVITTDKPLQDDCHDDILEAIITKLQAPKGISGE